MKLSICLTPSQAWADLPRVAEHTERSGWEGECGSPNDQEWVGRAVTVAARR